MGDNASVDTSGSDWASWFQNVAGSVIGKAADAQYVKPYDVQSLRLQQLGAGGYYVEGRPGAINSGMPTGLLLLAGVALVAVLILKD